MKPVLIFLSPLDTSQSPPARVDVRVADSSDPEDYGTAGELWLPAIVTRPQIGFELFPQDLSGSVTPGTAKFEISLDDITSVTNPRKLYWRGANCVIHYDDLLEGITSVPEFVGFVTSTSLNEDTGVLNVTATVTNPKIQRPLLTREFSGGGGLIIDSGGLPSGGGDSGFIGTLMPLGMGHVLGIQPIFFDGNRNIGMIDGYGSTISIDRVCEGLSDFGASVGDYATYTALAAAIDADNVPAGRWASCKAQGLIGLGAPPAGIITVDAHFSFEKPGDMLQRVCQLMGCVANVDFDIAAFASLTTEVNRFVHLWTADQVIASDLLKDICGSCNSSLIITLQGLISQARWVLDTTVQFTVDRSGNSGPLVTDWQTFEPQPPFYKIQARSSRPASVLTLDQINYVDTFVELGLYNSSTSYIAGNIVNLSDGSRWLYTNATASSGNAPPAPASSDSYWTELSPAITGTDPVYTDGTPIDALRPGEPGANVTETRVAAAITGQGPSATDSRGLDHLYAPGQNALYNPTFVLNLDTWVDSGTAWAVFHDTEGSYVKSPNGSGDFVLYSQTGIECTPGDAVVLSGDVYGSNSGHAFIDIQWQNLNNGAHISYSSTGINGGAGDAYWPSGTTYLPGSNSRKSQYTTAPSSTDGSATVVGFVRIISTNSVSPRLHISKLKFEFGTVATPYSDDATYGAQYGDQTLIDQLRPAEGGANATAGHIAAGIAGQGSLATSSTVSTSQLGVGAATGANFTGPSNGVFGSGPTTLASISYTPYDANSRLVYSICGLFLCQPETSATGEHVTVYLYVDGTQVFSEIVTRFTSETPFSYFITKTGLSGAHTFSIAAGYSDGGGGGDGAYMALNTFVQEFKKST